MACHLEWVEVSEEDQLSWVVPKSCPLIAKEVTLAMVYCWNEEDFAVAAVVPRGRGKERESNHKIFYVWKDW